MCVYTCVCVCVCVGLSGGACAIAGVTAEEFGDGKQETEQETGGDSTSEPSGEERFGVCRTGAPGTAVRHTQCFCRYVLMPQWGFSSGLKNIY